MNLSSVRPGLGRQAVMPVPMRSSHTGRSGTYCT